MNSDRLGADSVLVVEAGSLLVVEAEFVLVLVPALVLEAAELVPSLPPPQPPLITSRANAAAKTVIAPFFMLPASVSAVYDRVCNRKREHI
jgi:hypothetical protein